MHRHASALDDSGSGSGGSPEGGGKGGATAACAAGKSFVRGACASAPSTAASEMSTPGHLFICTLKLGDEIALGTSNFWAC